MIRARILPALSLTGALMTTWAAQAGVVYIPEGSAGSVLMVESETGQPIGRIAGVEAVHGLAGAPGTPYLVAGSFTEIDPESAAQTAKPEGVSQADHNAHHAKPAQAAMPTDKGLSLLTVLDAKTGDVVRRIEVPGAVHHTAVSPDGRWALATHPSGDGVSLIDLTTLDYAGFIATGPMPNYVSFSPDSSRAYVSNTGNGTLSELDLDSRILSRNLLAGEGPEHFALSRDGATAFVADAEAGTVLRLDIASGAETATYGFGAELHGLDLSDGEDTLFVAVKGADQVAAVDLASGAVRLQALAPAPYHLTVADGSEALFVSSREEPKVWVVNQASLQVTSEIGVESEGHQMVILP
ncbi:YncE family protein [Ruegeria sp. PrR005]|uniref:YncE family protein n=1 Tax=Ruegeria sp. PrR005 TaxID=2706882 RepID=A0A6B2NMQ5_9RHOB|nr:YncE family protein [Ruegeria sp. PrR005]NDW44540.1 YncE family protein [Ruegeria sp. PrR005]